MSNVEQDLKDAEALRRLAEEEFRQKFVSLFVAPNRTKSGMLLWQVFDLTMFQMTRHYDQCVLSEAETISEAVDKALAGIEKHADVIRKMYRQIGVDIDKAADEKRAQEMSDLN